MSRLFDRLQSTSETVAELSGRLVLTVVFVVALAIAGGYGYFIGSIGLKALRHIRVFGVTIFHPTPLGMAFYGMTTVGVALGTLAVAVRFAMRYDDQTPPE